MNDTNIDKNETYTFIFNSLNNKVIPSRAEFEIDWSVIPDQPYHVYFTYLGEVNNINGVNVPSIYVSSLNGNDIKVYNQNQQPLSAPSQANFLGLLRYDFIGNNSFIYADFKNNPPVYIRGRPSSGKCVISITSNAVSPFFTAYVPLLNDLNDFVLTMLFVPA